MMVVMNCLNVILIIYLLLIIALLTKESAFIVVTDQGTKDWSNANTYCNVTYGTTLVTISSIDVANEVVAAITNSSTPNAQMWLGLNDRETENVFVWADGTSCNTTSCNDYWGGNEPNNDNGNEHCVAILPLNQVYDIFNDYPCDNLRYFICNVRFTEVTTTSQPTTSQPTTSKPTTMEPTTREPTTSSPTGNPTGNPTGKPTTIQPTTMKPTTNNPTTIYPTTSPPTRDPSKKPSISQSTAPTEERSGSVETSTSTSTTSTGDDEDLTIKVTTNNGTFNQYHVIRTVNYSLNVFLDTGYTLTADIIHPNVSINFLIDIYDEEDMNLDINSSELTQKIQGDLNKDSDIIYVVEVTTNVEEEREMKHPFGFDKFNQLMMEICAVLVLVIIVSYIDAKWCRINDHYRAAALVIGVFQFVDMIYDCLFSIKITLDPDYSTQSPILFILLLLSIAFIVIPTFITLIQLHFEMKEWKRNDEVSQWMFHNTTLLYILSAICGSSFVAVRLCCSNFFSLTYFDMPLSQMQKSTFYTKRIYSSVMLENVPELIIQSVYLFVSQNAEHNDIVYASMSFSILSIVVSILSILSQQNIIKSRDFVVIEFDVKGDMILSKFNRCRNRYKILRKHLSLIFGVNSHQIEIRKPSLIPNGLRTHIIIHINNTKAIDLNCEKLIKDADQNGTLAEILKESWSLSGIPITGNVKYEKYDSQDRKDNTVMIKAMSESINNTGNGIITSIPMVPIPQMSVVSVDNTEEQVPGQYMPAVIPPVMITPYHDDNIEDVEHDGNLPAVIPPVVVTDYGKSNGNDMNHSDNSDDDNVNTKGGDEDVVQYINNVDNVTVGNL